MEEGDEKEEHHERNTEAERRRDQGFSDCASVVAKTIPRPLREARNTIKPARWRVMRSRSKQMEI